MDSQRWTSTSDRYLTPGPGDAWAAEASAAGQRGTQHILSVDTMPAPDHIADALALLTGGPVVVRRRLILVDERPVEIAESWWPADIAGNTPLVDQGKIPGGSVTLLAKLGHEPVATREVVTAAKAGDTLDPDSVRLLGLAPGDPVLILARTTHDDTGLPYEHSIMTRVAGQSLTYVRRGA